MSSLAPFIDIPNARQPAPGLLTGGQPNQAQLEAAIAAGYTFFINTRGHGEPDVDEAPAFFAARGVGFVHIPVGGAGDIGEHTARALADALAQAGDGPTMIYCGSGNRVGALCALKAKLVDGQSAEQAFAFGVSAGLTGLAPLVRQILG